VALCGHTTRTTAGLALDVLRRIRVGSSSPSTSSAAEPGGAMEEVEGCRGPTSVKKGEALALVMDTVVAAPTPSQPPGRAPGLNH
jgi:hypothetical protein